ncbi:GNAT family N-acetyltransferase [Nonomuraea sp. NPDC001699]
MATSGLGDYVVADHATDRLIGTSMLARRSPEDGGELELGHVLRRGAWGAGFAFEAATAVLRAAA